MKHMAYVAFGANLQQPQKQCARALELLTQNTKIQLLCASPWFRSKALTLNNELQPDYCNGVASFATFLEVQDFFQLLRQIEEQMGRPQDHEKWQARVIDLDLLLFDGFCQAGPELTLPHPELTKRLFVLQPLCSIAPELTDPLSGKKLSFFRDELLQTRAPLKEWAEV